MRCDVVLAGVGGQGVLAGAAIIAEAARRSGFTVKQGEIHGMSQRGGAVSANLRIADGPIESDLIPLGTAAMIWSLDPVEGLRYLEYLAPDGILVTSADPFVNIADYPELDDVLERVRSLDRSLVVPTEALARQAGSGHASNVVLLGAAAGFLPFEPNVVKQAVADFFAPKGEKVVGINKRAFDLGREAAAAAATVNA
jgi:indolepyruvate ferredoxin oxidoreductase beta subunit